MTFFGKRILELLFLEKGTVHFSPDQLCNTSKLFHAGDPYHIETSPFICRANQWTGFYVIGTSVMEELNEDFLRQSYGFFGISE